MSVARRSHEILVQEVRHLPRDWYDDNFWVGKYVMFAGTFQLACDSIVDPNPKFDQALNGLRDTFRKASTLESMFPPSTRT